MYKNILIAYDGSDSAKLALKRAVQISKEWNPALTVLWVKDFLPHFVETIDEAQEEKEMTDIYAYRLADEIKQFVKQENIAIDFVTLSGNPARVVVDYAKSSNAELIITGHTSHRNLWGNLLGNTADKISDHAPCDVLIVRQEMT